MAKSKLKKTRTKKRNVNKFGTAKTTISAPPRKLSARYVLEKPKKLKGLKGLK